MVRDQPPGEFASSQFTIKPIIRNMCVHGSVLRRDDFRRRAGFARKSSDTRSTIPPSVDIRSKWTLRFHAVLIHF
jgi:hypothetical protein